MESRVAILLVALLLTTQSVGPAQLPLTISYGRSWPQSVVADSAKGVVYVDATSGIFPPIGFSFGVINVSAHSLVKTLPLEVDPTAMAFDPGRDYAYVAGSNTVEVFYGVTQEFVANISVGRPVAFMAADSGTGNLYLASGEYVYEVKTPVTPSGSFAVVANASIGTDAGGLAVDASNGRLYVAGYASDLITVLDSSSLGPMGTIKAPSCCLTQLALNPSSQVLYATTGTNFMDMVNAETDSYAGRAQVAPSSANSTSNLAIDPGSGRVFVSFSAGSSVAELNPDGSLLGYLKATSTPAGMAVDAATGELYVSNYHQVTVFDARASFPGSDYTYAYLAAAGAGVAALALVLVLRGASKKDRDRR